MRSIKAPGSPSSTVAHHELVVTGLLSYQCPLASRGKTRPTSSPHTTGFDLLNHLLRRHFLQTALQGCKAPTVAVFVQITGIDDAAMLGGNVTLFTQEVRDRLIPQIQGSSRTHGRFTITQELIQPA